jgi:hypothetical protein
MIENDEFNNLINILTILKASIQEKKNDIKFKKSKK